ncbi:hypothetical protein [Kalamiella sp. sgz302252]|uniref:hypothetical protein n=1 Tax=Pantoea sp. sgz302252 TaxID=3341827 RepID=UPI0036D419E7
MSVGSFTPVNSKIFNQIEQCAIKAQNAGKVTKSNLKNLVRICNSAEKLSLQEAVGIKSQFGKLAEVLKKQGSKIEGKKSAMLDKAFSSLKEKLPENALEKMDQTRVVKNVIKHIGEDLSIAVSELKTKIEDKLNLAEDLIEKLLDRNLGEKVKDYLSKVSPACAEKKFGQLRHQLQAAPVANNNEKITRPDLGGHEDLSKLINSLIRDEARLQKAENMQNENLEQAIGLEKDRFGNIVQLDKVAELLEGDNKLLKRSHIKVVR